MEAKELEAYNNELLKQLKPMPIETVPKDYRLVTIWSSVGKFWAYAIYAPTDIIPPYYTHWLPAPPHPKTNQDA